MKAPLPLSSEAKATGDGGLVLSRARPELVPEPLDQNFSAKTSLPKTSLPKLALPKLLYQNFSCESRFSSLDAGPGTAFRQLRRGGSTEPLCRPASPQTCQQQGRSGEEQPQQAAAAAGRRYRRRQKRQGIGPTTRRGTQTLKLAVGLHYSGRFWSVAVSATSNARAGG